MSRRLIPILLCLFAVGSASAQTGKVTGTVTDLVSGEPLPGVNVVIEGTTQGASTGIDGKFIIIGVRPGVYDVLASFIGFSRQRREGVQVNVDLTTTVDFQMAEEVVEGEEIVVTAEAVAVRKDLTSSEARITAETIDKLPVTELSQVLDVQAGVTTRNGIHIRGGRSSEVVFMVDGVPVSDSYDGSSVIQLENDGIEELQVISGTFNAEYGNAMSGIVNVVTKEGRSDRFSGSAQVYAGGYAVTGEGGADFLRGIRAEEYSRAGIQYRDIDPYSYLPFQADHFQNATVSLEGPIWKDRITFFALGASLQKRRLALRRPPFRNRRFSGGFLAGPYEQFRKDELAGEPQNPPEPQAHPQRHRPRFVFTQPFVQSGSPVVSRRTLPEFRRGLRRQGEAHAPHRSPNVLHVQYGHFQPRGEGLSL